MTYYIEAKDKIKALWIKKFPRGVNYPLFAYILLLIFSGEFAVMLVLPYLLPQHHERLLESLVDSLLLSFVVAPGLFPLLHGFNQRSRRSERALANIHEGYWLIDKSGNIVDVNEGYSRLIGYSREEILSMQPEHLAVDQSNTFVGQIMQRIHNRDSTLIETRQRHKHGHNIDIEASVSFEPETGFFVVFLRNVSQRNADERTMYETSSRLEHFVSHSSTIIFAVRQLADSLETVWVSGNLPRILGYSVEEAMQPGWWEARLHPDDKTHTLTATQALFAGTTLNHEYRFQHRNGSIRWIQDNQQLLIEGDSRQSYIIISWHDITEQKLSEIALQRSEQTTKKSLIMLEQRQFAIDQHAIVSITDIDGNITYVNDRFCASSGYTREELLGENHRLLNSEKHSQAFFEEMYRTLNRGEIWQAEVCNRSRTGRLYYLESTIAPIYNEKEQIYQYIAIRTDITHRKLMEQELKLAATTFEVQEGVMITDSNNRIIRINKAFSQLTGYSSDEAIGQYPSMLKSDRHDQSFYEAMWQAITRQHYWQGEIWNQRKNGEIYPEWLTVTAIPDESGNINNYVGIFSDISKDKEYTETIYNLAFYDPLTELPNRRLFLDRLQHSIAMLTRSDKHGALLFIDADNFKSLNDTKGHQTGDMLLTLIAERLLSCVRANDTVARLGGDEFVIMLEDLSEDVNQALVQTELVGEKVLWVTSRPYRLDNQDYSSTVSIGISLYDKTSNDNELLKHADTAMYQSKAAGRNTLHFFNPEMLSRLEDRIELENDLRQAVTKQQLKLFYQAQITDANKAIGAEVLLRWLHPEWGWVPPDKFIPIAEQIGVINEIGDWVLLNACRQLKQWEAHTVMGGITLAVNVSPCQFRQNDFVHKVVETIRISGIEPNRLKLEITESTIIDDIDNTIAKMQTLKKIGVSFSLDDFGTGYSSLAILKKLPLDQLKIDKSFVSDIPQDPNDAAIAQTIIAISITLGLDVIAEGVETEEQRAFLSEHGCRIYQGYLYSKPVPIEDLTELIEALQAGHNGYLPIEQVVSVLS